MTLQQAIGEVERVGSIRVENGKLRLRFPDQERARLEAAIDTLRHNRDVALLALAPKSGATVPPPTGDTDGAGKKISLSYWEWKAQDLNRLFEEQGTTGRPANILAETVLDGFLQQYDNSPVDKHGA